MWRAKEKLRDTDIVVTEDSQQRLLDLMKEEADKIKKKEALMKSPVKAKKPSQNGPPASPKKAPVPMSPVKKSTSLMSFSYASSKPNYLQKTSTLKRSESMRSPIKVQPKTKTIFDSDEEDYDETDFFDNDDDYVDEMLEDFPQVPKSPKKVTKEALPDSPQKALFQDFMF